MKNKICAISLFSAILASVSTMPSYAAVRAKNSNRSYADAYQQINALRYQQEYMNANPINATTASVTANLPVAVDDELLAEQIVSGTAEGIGISDLESCSMIYPNGIFRWALPQSGIRQNQTNQCVAVVELRDANTNAVLATTTVASGDSMKCNIDSFPESGMNVVALSKTLLPADAAPTMAEVEAVMNQEQKQNAGLKIAAAAIVSGVAGNILAPKSAGDSKIIGTGKTQLVDTAIGAATGASIMAASTYTGKVAGDTIKSTAINAASGAVVGNMLAGMSNGNSILATMKCKIETGEKDCIIGAINTLDDEPAINNGMANNKYYFIKKNSWDEILACDRKEINGYEYLGECETVAASKYVKKMCANQNLKLVACDSLKDSEYNNITHSYKLDTDTRKMVQGASTDPYLILYSAYETKSTSHAYAVFENGLKNKISGYKVSDWKDISKKGNIKYYLRNSDGSVGKPITETNIEFTPQSREASDGGLIDMSNQARAKGTAAGAAAGGAMGGFAAYQGAKTEISDRWTSAVREYEDSLSNFVCMTGGRFLSKYNDYVQIPTMQKSE